jgi:long-subunit acyl-CoA synthetase (AMP-forming)
MHSVFNALNINAKTNPTAIAFRDGQTEVTWQSLLALVSSLSGRLQDAQPVVGIFLPNSVDYVVADLAATLSGRRVVPLPAFFSKGQIAHVIQNADIGTIIAGDDGGLIDDHNIEIVNVRSTTLDAIPANLAYQGNSERVIYTSGSSGSPKGVVLGDEQIEASLAGLGSAIRPSSNEKHLSLLPLSQLLEQICGIFLPILAGGQTTIVPEATAALFGGPIDPVHNAFINEQPTTSLLAPNLLRNWVAYLKSSGQAPPDSLRFLAVGGAPTAVALIQEAEKLGLPVYEGYGLSECCSVVALNRPGHNQAGTVGQTLDGITVMFDEGEIIIAGPTVMRGYLGQDGNDNVPWRTGDLGHFVNDCLVVNGRKDALIITPAGRNISPEWVEKATNANPKVVSSCLTQNDSGSLVLMVASVQLVSVDEIETALEHLPAYARPSQLIFVDPQTPGFIFPAGTPNRAVAKRLSTVRASTTLHFSNKTKA